jgi:MYXO-CTERM domain-containing protein
MEVLNGGVWSSAPEAEAINTAGVSGVTGHLQDMSLANDQLIIGGTRSALPTGSLLWSGTSTDGGLPTGVDAVPAPPLMRITCPAPNATVGGTVVMSADASATMGLKSVVFAIDNPGTPLCTLSSPPFTCAWDTTTSGDGAHTVFAATFDSQGFETFSDFSVTVQTGASGACSPPDASTGDAGGTLDASTPDALLDSGRARDGGQSQSEDAGVSDARGTTRESGPTDAGSPMGDAGPTSRSSGGCSCRIAERSGQSTPREPFVLALLAVATLVRRKRT